MSKSFVLAVAAALISMASAAPLISGSVSQSCVDGATYDSTRGTFTMQCGVKYQGGDYSSLQTPSFGDCLTACDADTKCVGASYANGVCSLKQTLTNSVQKRNVDSVVLSSCVDGATYTAADGTQFIESCQTDFYGGDLILVQTSSFTGCIDACATTSECIDLSYVSGNCYLKSTLTAAVSNINVDAARIVGVIIPTTSSTTTTVSTTSTLTTTTSTTTTTVDPTTTSTTTVDPTTTSTTTVDPTTTSTTTVDPTTTSTTTVDPTTSTTTTSTTTVAPTTTTATTNTTSITSSAPVSTTSQLQNRARSANREAEIRQLIQRLQVEA